MRSEPFEPDRARIEQLMSLATDFITGFITGLPAAPATNTGLPDPYLPPAERPGDFDRLLATFGDAAAQSVETAGPGYLAYFPAGGLFSSALAELLSSVVNRYTGISSTAPHLVAMEESVLRWLCRTFELPPTSGGLTTTGGSMANLAALVAARRDRLGHDYSGATIYVTEHTHHSIAKAAMIAGLRPDQLRTVPVTADHRMDVTAAEALISADPRPFLLVGTAGSTSTGTVDPLADLAALAARHGLWFHVDAAYGGGFQLTERGRARLAGIERADSIALDPHKTMFMPYGTGVLLVRDLSTLAAAHAADADYLQDHHRHRRLPDYADLGPELTREYRGLRMWLPLHLHGVAAFRAALDEKLDLAATVHGELSDTPQLAPPPSPDLTVNVFRLRDRDDGANRRLLDRVNAGRRIFLSSTRLRQRYFLRMCVLSHRTHLDRVDEAMAIVRTACEQAAAEATSEPA